MVKKAFIRIGLLLFFLLGSPLRLEGSPPTQADLEILKIATPVTADVGRFVNYGLEISNFGPDPAEGVVVTDTLPMGMQFNGATEEICDEMDGTVTCDLGTLESGDSQLVSIVVLVTLPGKIDNTAQVDSLTPDPDLGNNTSTFSVVVVGSGGGGLGASPLSCSFSRPRAATPPLFWQRLKDILPFKSRPWRANS